MRRWGLIFALLVSAGLNAGILVTLWVTRGRNAPQPGPMEGAPPATRPGEAPGPGRPGVPPPAGDPRGVPGGFPYDPGPGPGPPVRRPEDRPENRPENRPGDRPENPPAGRPYDGSENRGGPPPVGPRPPFGPPPTPDDGVFGGENGEVGPEPGTVLPVPSTPPPRMAEFADRLGVTGDKRKRFFALQLQMIARMREGRWSIQQLRREVRVEMLSERPDRTKIEAKLAAIQSTQLALERETVRTILATREILDGEAERKYLELITRLRLGVVEPRPNVPRPGGNDGRMGRPGFPQGPPSGFEPRFDQGPNGQGPPPRGENPQGQAAPGLNPQTNLEPRFDRPRFDRPQPGERPGMRPGIFPRGQRPLTPRERLERRRLRQEWMERQGGGGPAPETSDLGDGASAPPPTR